MVNTVNAFEKLVSQVATETGVAEDSVRKIMHSLGLDRVTSNTAKTGATLPDLKDLILAVKISPERFVAR